MADELRTLKEEDISSKLLSSKIFRRHMGWFLVTEGELEEFRKVDAESSDYLTLGVAALAVAIGLFGSSFTITSEHFTLPQLVMFYVVPAFSGIIGLFWTNKGSRGRSAVSTKRETDIARIQRESHVAVETRIIPDSDMLPMPTLMPINSEAKD